MLSGGLTQKPACFEIDIQNLFCVNTNGPIHGGIGISNRSGVNTEDRSQGDGNVTEKTKIKMRDERTIQRK